MPKRCLFTIESITPAEPAPAWYALQTRGSFERSSANDLVSREVESYAPERTEIRTWSDRRQTIQVPLFPGYMFARFVDTMEIRVHVLRTRGVVKILGDGREIYPVPDEQISGIWRLLESGIPCVTHPTLHAGQDVRVVVGAMTGVSGVLVEFRGRQRLAVRVPLLGRDVITELDERYVEPVSPRAAVVGRTAADAPLAGWRG